MNNIFGFNKINFISILVKFIYAYRYADTSLYETNMDNNTINPVQNIVAKNCML